jgi:hypothetical protein
MHADAQPQSSLIRRLRHELKQYAVVSLYLYVCFGAILFYEAAALQADGIHYAPFGFAAVKSLILAKFMLIGHAMHAGERFEQRPLIYPVLYKSSVFLVMLTVLSVIEETISGIIHGRTLAGSLADIFGGTWMHIAATCLLMWLILVPYFAFRQTGEVLGSGRLYRMFFIGQ